MSLPAFCSSLGLAVVWSFRVGGHSFKAGHNTDIVGVILFAVPSGDALEGGMDLLMASPTLEWQV